MGISLQEFVNKDLINNLEFDINYENILHLQNKKEDIYLICSHNTKLNFNSIIEKLIADLKLKDIKIKNFYYINETFTNINSNKIFYDKLSLCLQHLIGYKIQNNTFVDKKITKYSKLYFYDDNFDTIKMPDEINAELKSILVHTDSGLKEVIKEDIKDNKAEFIVNKITNNKYNKFISKTTTITLSNISTFENFKYK